MRESKLISVFLLFNLILFSCKKDGLSEIRLDTNDIDEFQEYLYDDSHSSDYIYSQSELHRFDLYISDENLALIDNNPTAEQYVVGSLVFEDKVINDVGIRYKGSIGAWVGCLSGYDWSEPSGYKTCPKLSMKIKI